MQRNGTTPHTLATLSPQPATPPHDTLTTLHALAAPAYQPATTAQQQAILLDEPATPMYEPAAPAQQPAAPAHRRATRRSPLASYRADAGMAERLAAAQQAIDAVLADPALLAAMDAHGYDAARMQEGHALRERALTLFQEQRAQYGERYAATDSRASLQAQTHATYTRHLTIARITFRDDRGAAQKLGLAARRRRERAGWLLQARQFYANALAEGALVDRLSAYRITRDVLEAGERAVAAVEAATVAEQRLSSAARAATGARNAALGALDRWMRDFQAIARIALSEQPQAPGGEGVV